MTTRQGITRTEFKVTIRTSLGTVRTEWRRTSEAAEALRERFDVIDITEAEHLLDF